jgi:hypothetical protein
MSVNVGSRRRCRSRLQCIIALLFKQIDPEAMIEPAGRPRTKSLNDRLARTFLAFITQPRTPAPAVAAEQVERRAAHGVVAAAAERVANRNHRRHESAEVVARGLGVSVDYVEFGLKRAGLSAIYRKHCRAAPKLGAQSVR